MEASEHVKGVIKLEQDLWGRLCAMFKVFSFLPTEMEIIPNDYITIFSASLRLFVSLHKIDYQYILQEAQFGWDVFDNLMCEIYASNSYRNEYAIKADSAFKKAINLMCDNEQFAFSTFKMFQIFKFDFLEALVLPSILNRGKLLNLLQECEKMDNIPNNTVKGIEKIFDEFQNSGEISNQNYDLNADFFNIKELFECAANENTLESLLIFKKGKDDLKRLSIILVQKLETGDIKPPKEEDLKHVDDFWNNFGQNVNSKETQTEEMNKYKQELKAMCGWILKNSQSEAATDDPVDPEVVGDLAPYCVTGRSLQIDRRNSIKTRNSLRESSPESLRAKNTKVPKEFESIVHGKTSLYPDGKKGGKDIERIVPTMNLSTKKTKLSENSINRMRILIRKYETGYIMDKDSEEQQDNYFLDNFHIFLENVPAGEALARVSFLLWICDSCKAYFFTEYRFCPICHLIPKEQYMEKRHISYRTAKSFLNALEQSSIKTNTKLFEARKSVNRLKDHLGKLQTKTAETEKIESELVETKQKLEISESAKTAAEREIEQIKAQLKEALKEVSETKAVLEKKIKETETTQFKNMSIVRERSAETEEMQKEMDKIQSALKEKNKIIEENNNHIKTLKLQKTAIETENQSLNTSIEKNFQYVSEMTEKIETLKKQRDAAQTSADKANAAGKLALEDHQQTQRALSAASDKMAEQIKTLRAEKKQLLYSTSCRSSAAEGRILTMETEMSKMASGVKRLTEANAALEKELEAKTEAFRRTAAKSAGNAAAAGKLEKQAQELRGRCAELEGRLRTLSGQIEGERKDGQKRAGRARLRMGLFLAFNVLLVVALVLSLGEAPFCFKDGVCLYSVLRVVAPARWIFLPT